MKTDLFIRSYRRDFGWLSYCLKSIKKFTSGFDHVNLVVPEQDYEEALRLTAASGLQIRVFGVQDGNLEGYLAQQYTKMCAPDFSEAEMFVFVDSDCVFLKPVTPEHFLTNGRPRLLVTSYDAMRDDHNACCWQAITERAIGVPCPYETMRQMPPVFLRSTLLETRDHIERVHSRNLRRYLFACPRRSFSEFNALGSFAVANHPERYEVLDTIKDLDKIPEPIMKQFWSWSGVTPEIAAELLSIVE